MNRNKRNNNYNQGNNPQNNNQNYNNQQYNNEYNNEYSEQNYNDEYYDNQGNYNHYDNQYYQNNQQYFDEQNNQQRYIPPQNNYNPNNHVPPYYVEEAPKEKKKSIIPVIITAIVTFAVLVVGLYFGYNKFIKKENIADLSSYEVNFVTIGTDGEGKPEIDIKKVPEVSKSSSEISNLLANPDISFDRKNNLKNGDKVEVTITVNKNSAEKLNLKTTGEFKRTFTVNGLTEKAKEKETIIVRDSSSNSSISSNRTNFSHKAAKIYVEAGVNLRSSSNDNSTVLATAKKGDTVYVDYTERNSKGETWAYVTYNGKEGWMRADLIGH